MMKRMKKIAIVVFALSAMMLLASCTPPKLLIAQHFEGEKAVLYILEKTGETVGEGEDSQELYHYLVRVCDYGADGKPTNCQTTKVLEHVYPHNTAN